jgi:hypothetical protein
MVLKLGERSGKGQILNNAFKPHQFSNLPQKKPAQTLKLVPLKSACPGVFDLPNDFVG